jgi:hypothetical protein
VGCLGVSSGKTVPTTDSSWICSSSSSSSKSIFSLNADVAEVTMTRRDK